MVELQRYRWNIASLLALIAIYLATVTLIDSRGARFTVYLVLFTLWMALFVVTAAQYLTE